jgi:hypothetical protein
MMYIVVRGWALSEQGHRAEGMAQMQQGIATYQSAGTAVELPSALMLLAEAYGKGGKREEGMVLLDETLALVDKTEERNGAAELYRMKGSGRTLNNIIHSWGGFT